MAESSSSSSSSSSDILDTYDTNSELNVSEVEFNKDLETTKEKLDELTIDEIEKRITIKHERSDKKEKSKKQKRSRNKNHKDDDDTIVLSLYVKNETERKTDNGELLSFRFETPNCYASLTWSTICSLDADDRFVFEYNNPTSPCKHSNLFTLIKIFLNHMQGVFFPLSKKLKIIQFNTDAVEEQYVDPKLLSFLKANISEINQN